jgi:two-component system sensor histidine kinase DesK
MGALASFGFAQLLRRNQQLTQAREQIARLAVADERLRFARDLHDLLGHSLTVMAVKADLAGKLMVRAPDRARTEIADLERLDREALTDVRATVAGYRATSLATEISHARRSLEAAGIAADLPLAVDDVPPPRRELLGWVVREGTTNVVRHSRARSWRARRSAGARTGGVEVADHRRCSPTRSLTVPLDLTGSGAGRVVGW